MDNLGNSRKSAVPISKTKIFLNIQEESKTPAGLTILGRTVENPFTFNFEKFLGDVPTRPGKKSELKNNPLSEPFGFELDEVKSTATFSIPENIETFADKWLAKLYFACMDVGLSQYHIKIVKGPVLPPGSLDMTIKDSGEFCHGIINAIREYHGGHLAYSRTSGKYSHGHLFFSQIAISKVCGDDRHLYRSTKMSLLNAMTGKYAWFASTPVAQKNIESLVRLVGNKVNPLYLDINSFMLSYEENIKYIKHTWPLDKDALIFPFEKQIFDKEHEREKQLWADHLRDLRENYNVAVFKQVQKDCSRIVGKIEEKFQPLFEVRARALYPVQKKGSKKKPMSREERLEKLDTHQILKLLGMGARLLKGYEGLAPYNIPADNRDPLAFATRRLDELINDASQSEVFQQYCAGLRQYLSGLDLD
jgi:hypothetical protein